MCPHTTVYMCLVFRLVFRDETRVHYMCPHTTIYQTYRILVYICVLILLYICVLILLYTRPHNTIYIYVSSCYLMCVLAPLYVSSYSYICPHATICVLILLYTNLQLYLSSSSYSYMCLHTTIFVVLILLYICVLILQYTCVLVLLYMRQWGRRLQQARAGVDSFCFSLPFCSQGSFGSVVCGQMHTSTRHICRRSMGALRYIYSRQIS
jgi:hypothetical protein